MGTESPAFLLTGPHSIGISCGTCKFPTGARVLGWTSLCPLTGELNCAGSPQKHGIRPSRPSDFFLCLGYYYPSSTP